MDLSLNPYFIGRWQYECLNKRKEGLDSLMAYFSKELGTPAFHTYHEAIFESKVGEYDVFNQFDFAISTMMFREVTFGSSDYLSLDLTYGDVFVTLWKLFPDRCWLDHLRFKDFRSASLDQLYINPVPSEEWGETKSVGLIQSILEKEASSGWLIFKNSKKGFGQIRILEDSLREINSEAWGGLKEWMLQTLPLKLVTITDLARWNSLYEESPQQVIERFINLVWNGTPGWGGLLTHFSTNSEMRGIRDTIIQAIQLYQGNNDASSYFLKVARVAQLDAEGTFLEELLEVLRKNVSTEVLGKYFSS